MGDDSFPHDGSSGSGHSTAYSVEARFTGHQPRQVGDLLLDERWQRISFEEGKCGIPNQLIDRQARELGLLTYQAAQALRWWFHANQGFRDLCLETRIIKHTVSHSYKEIIEGAYEIIGCDKWSSHSPARQEPEAE